MLWDQSHPYTWRDRNASRTISRPTKCIGAKIFVRESAPKCQIITKCWRWSFDPLSCSSQTLTESWFYVSDLVADGHDDPVCIMQKKPPLISFHFVNLGSGCWLVMLQNVKCSASAMLTRMIRCVWCEMPLLWCHPSHFVGSPVCATQNEGFCHHHLYFTVHILFLGSTSSEKVE